MAEQEIVIPAKKDEFQENLVEFPIGEDTSIETVDETLQAEVDSIEEKDIQSILDNTGTSQQFQIEQEAEVVMKLNTAGARVTTKLAAGDLKFEPTQEDLDHFSDRDLIAGMGKLLKNELATDVINKMEKDLLSPLKALDELGFQELEDSGKLLIMKQGLQLMAAKAIESGEDEDSAAVRKYMVQIFLGKDTPEYKVNELYKDLEEIIRKEIIEDPAFGEAMEEIDLTDGVSLEEYNKFVALASEKMVKQMSRDNIKAQNKVWEEIRRVFTGFTPLEESTAFEMTEEGYAVQTQSLEQDSTKYTEFGYFDNILIGTFYGNGSVFNTTSFQSNEFLRQAPGLEFLGLAMQLLEFVFPKDKEQVQFEKEMDRVFGKDKWKGMTLARIMREAVIAYASGGLGNVAMASLGKIFASGKIVAETAVKATNLSKLTRFGTRPLETATSIGIQGVAYGTLDYGADAAAIKIQGKEITGKIEAELEEKLIHMYLFAGGFGILGGVFSLGKAGVSPTVRALQEKLKKNLNVWAKTKSVQWMDMMKDKIGPAVAFTKAQKLGHLFPKGTQKRQQAHIESLKPKVSSDPSETLRQLEQAAKATGAEGMGEAGAHAEHLLAREASGPTLTGAAQQLKNQRDFLPGDIGHRLTQLAKIEKEVFPIGSEKDSLFNITQKSINNMLEKFKLKSISNLTPFANKELGTFSFMETSTRDAAKGFHDVMLPILSKAKNRSALEIALRASSSLEKKLTPLEFVGDLGGHPKDFVRYEQIRNLYDEAAVLYNEALSRGFNQKGFKTVKGTLSPDGGQILARPYTTDQIFGEVDTANYAIEGVLESKAGLEFTRFLKSLNKEQADKEIVKLIRGDTFVVETNFGTGIDVLTTGVRGRIVKSADLEDITQPMAVLQGYFPGYRNERHLILQINKEKVAQKAQLGGTEGGLKDSSVTVTHAAPRYSIAKRQFDELIATNKDTNIEYMLLDNSSTQSSQITANVDFMQSLGEKSEELTLSMLADISKRLGLNDDARQQLATAIHKVTKHPTMTDRVKGQAARGLGKNKGAPIFEMTKEGRIKVGWDTNAVPYTLPRQASSEYLNNLARELGEKDIVQGTKRYFVENYGEFLSVKGDVYSPIIESKFIGTAIEKASLKERLLSFQRIMALYDLRGDSVLLRNIGHKMVQGAKVANDRLEGNNPLSHITKGILDSFSNNPNLPKQAVGLARKFASIRLFALNLRVAAFQVLPALENITYSMVGPKHLLEPIGVARDASTYLLYALGKYTTRGAITKKMMGLRSVRRALDIEKAIDQTGIIRELKMVTPGGVDSLSELVLGNSINPIYKAGTEIFDWLLYFQFRAGEGFNKLIASSATYRRMEIFRDAALKAQKSPFPMKPEQVEALRFWSKTTEGDFILSNEGISAMGNEARLIAGDMARKANFPITNRNFLGVQFQYNGILIPRLMERYMPGYGRIFSPGRQFWNMAQISTYLGIGGVAGLVDVVGLYQDTMNRIFTRPDATGDVMIQRHIDEFAQVLADTSDSLDGDTTKEQWNRLIRSGAIGKHLSAHPGDIQKFLPAKMFSDMISNYAKEGFLPLVVVKASPVMSQIEATVEAGNRGYQILEEMFRNLPEEGLTQVLLDPNARPEQLVYLGDTFKRMMKAVSYKSGVSNLIMALEVFSDDWDGRQLVDNQGRAITVPFPTNDPDDKRFRNFISLWMGIFPDAREELRQFGADSKKNRNQWIRDVGRIFQKKLVDLNDPAAADAYLDSADKQIEGLPDENILRLNLLFTIARIRMEAVSPSSVRNLQQMGRMLLKQELVGEDALIIQDLVTPIKEKD